MRRKWDRLVVMAVILFAPAALARAQTPFPPGWTGWARCQLTVQGPGYSDQQTHTWVLAGSPPAVEGAFRVYAAKRSSRSTASTRDPGRLLIPEAFVFPSGPLQC